MIGLILAIVKLHLSLGLFELVLLRSGGWRLLGNASINAARASKTEFLLELPIKKISARILLHGVVHLPHCRCNHILSVNCAIWF